ncbi:hypothetical protein C2S53_010944 [Perilla frutescens var. hirtella]|uniref:Uncharacterized protein n=1 Tax=Perilla frutescens var. hirtella TaxID=608512 RepID=A0AAD4PB42_PERFH|nr:hypothetical protein C2S53_010944 [Perilla frutescens var. hirtella]
MTYAFLNFRDLIEKLFLKLLKQRERELRLKLQSVMECGSDKNMHDNNQSCSKGRVPEHGQWDVFASQNPIPSEQRDPSGSAEVNMEVPITADDVMRAGGFGATDDIGTILPAASDFNDFEDHFHDVQRYEGSKDKIAEAQSGSRKINFEAGKANTKATDKVQEGLAPEAQEVCEAINMEAYVTSDEMIRAGGFGATDNISSFLPVASDFTDFEESLRDAREYEESEEKSNRPGLGWKDETNEPGLGWRSETK